MHILTFETTGECASAAVIDADGVLAEESGTGALNHLETLMPMTERLLNKAGVRRSDLSCIAASEGPGSFTGIRIGVASARALAQALNLPALGVPTLQAFCFNAPGFAGLICPILNARRSQVYGGAWRWEGDGIREVCGAGGFALEEYLNRIEEDARETGVGEILLFGDGINAYEEEIKQWRCSSHIGNIRINMAEDNRRLQRASSAAQLALILFQRGKAGEPGKLKPVYLRKAEAERKLEAGLLGRKAEGSHG